jgi:hypothetical protein
MSYPRGTVMSKRRRLTLRGGCPRLERTLLTEQSNPVDVGAWLDEHHANARARGRFVPYVILEEIADGIAPLAVTDPTPLIDYAREAHG